MKNKFILLKILIIVVTVGILSAVMRFYSLKSKESNASSMFCVRQEFQLNDEQYDACINYPQLSGMNDKEKEKRLNAMIEKDAMKVLEQGALDYPEYQGRFSVSLDYDIKDMNDQIISILYKGCFVPVGPGKGIPAVAMATTIDMEEERILTLENAVADYDLLYDLLMEDKFENITKWDGVAGQYKVSKEYEHKLSTLLEDLNGDDRDIEWYIDNEHFVIVILNGMADYNEYAISLQDARGFLQKKFLL